MLGNNRFWVFLFTIMLIGVVTVAQEKSQTIIKNVPCKETSAASGKDMYKAYCAVCHGNDGKGAGPAASAMKVPPTDLTVLSKNNGGKYPSLKVVSSINGETNLPAHGSREMPVWGQLFWSMSQGRGAEVQQRAVNLAKYIETLQAK